MASLRALLRALVIAAFCAGVNSSLELATSSAPLITLQQAAR
ncbi:hypothetical protein CPL00374_CDS0044 [Klebsiella phage Keithsmous]|uniref:Uncharacterized protein n=1 Tax=Klebsiella phage Keithsmous TaxID=3098263 RepID=A0ABZ2EP86_9CAUD